MKSKSLATLGVLALLATTSAFGEQKLTADIPFEFHVGSKVMPAGHYSVNRNFSELQGVLQLWCRECRTGTIARTSNVGESVTPLAKGRLVFHRYGDTYFLSEVWSPESRVGIALPKSKGEREIARNPSLERTNLIVLAQR